jgi:putative NADH-flavin reductase
MARVLVIGASKGVGLETVRSALAAGHDVCALARSATSIGRVHPKLEKVRGDALNEVDVAAALEGIDVVIQTLGIGIAEMFRPVQLFSAATRVLIAAMTAKGVRRLICLTGFGAGESHASVGLLQRVPFQIVFGRAYRDKTLQENLLTASSLEWTIVRPGVLTNGRYTGRYQVLERPSEWRNGLIARADVADFLVRQIGSTAGIRKSYVLVN